MAAKMCSTIELNFQTYRYNFFRTVQIEVIWVSMQWEHLINFLEHSKLKGRCSQEGNKLVGALAWLPRSWIQYQYSVSVCRRATEGPGVGTSVFNSSAVLSCSKSNGQKNHIDFLSVLKTRSPYLRPPAPDPSGESRRIKYTFPLYFCSCYF